MQNFAGAAVGIIIAYILGGLISFAVFFILKTALSFAVLRAFDAKVGVSGPLPADRCVGFGALRTALEIVAIAVLFYLMKRVIGPDSPIWWAIAWVGLCAMRAAAWWAVGVMCTGFRGRTLRRLIALGVGVDVMFDGIVWLVYFGAIRAP